MKLKLVVASMSILGLISSPVLADTQAKKHHHHKKVHHVVHDYKAMGGLPVQPASMMEAPKVDSSQSLYDVMSQNTGRSKAMPDWFNRVGVSGGINADAKWGNRSVGYAGENNKRVALNDAYLNVSAGVNDWVKAFLGLDFNNTSNQLATGLQERKLLIPVGDGTKPGVYSAAYANNRFSVEQGYLTVGNLDATPVFFQVGKQFQDFGRYTIHPLTESMTQVLSESLATSAKLGFISGNGLHGDVYAFDNNMRENNNSHTKTIYGAALGYDQANDQLGFDFGASYLSSMTGVNAVALAVGQFNGTSNNGYGGSYAHNVGAYALYGDVNSGPFNLGVRYTSAIQNFSAADLSNNYSSVGAGAKPWAADVTAGYGFNTMSKNQNVYLGYQSSNNAVNVFLPKSRWVLGYGVDMWKNTNITVEGTHDVDYSTSKGGTGNSSNTIGARFGAKFG